MRLFLLLVPAMAWAQADSPISTQSLGNANEAYTQILHYTTGNVDYICKAKSIQSTIGTITVSAISNANPGSMTAASHGFYYSATATQKIAVFISGLTGNWTPLNGTHVLTPASTSTLTTDVDTTAFGAVTGTIVVSTRAPKSTATIWSVQSLGVDGSGNTTLVTWEAPATGAALTNLSGGQTSFRYACAPPTATQ